MIRNTDQPILQKGMDQWPNKAHFRILRNESIPTVVFLVTGGGLLQKSTDHGKIIRANQKYHLTESDNSTSTMEAGHCCLSWFWQLRSMQSCNSFRICLCILWKLEKMENWRIWKIGENGKSEKSEKNGENGKIERRKKVDCLKNIAS